VAGWWSSPVSSTNKTDRHDITEILLKVALSSLTLIKFQIKKKKKIFSFNINNGYQNIMMCSFEGGKAISRSI
jgi:hypothetical protein